MVGVPAMARADDMFAPNGGVSVVVRVARRLACVTERVIALDERDGLRTLITRAGAGSAQRSWSVNAAQRVARVEGVLPYTGYVVATVRLPAFAGVAIVGALTLLSPTMWQHVRRRLRRAPHHGPVELGGVEPA